MHKREILVKSQFLLGKFAQRGKFATKRPSTSILDTSIVKIKMDYLPAWSDKTWQHKVVNSCGE